MSVRSGQPHSGSEWNANLAHVTEYGVLAALVLWAIRSALPTSSIAAVAMATWLVCVLYGISDEYHQSFVANRDSNPLDVGFDGMGSALTLIVLLTISAARRGETS